MKQFIKSAVFSTAILLSLGAQAQDSSYYNRLFFTCKTWGHVKYYHTETANGSVNWDDALLDALGSIKSAPDNDAFNQALLQMLDKAGAMGFNPAILPNVADSLNNNNDFSWIQDPIFSDTVRGVLDTIRTRFRPQGNFYVGEAWAGGNPTFLTDSLYYTEVNFPTEEKRILALFRYWNIINIFYPYKNIMDQSWDATLLEFLPQIVEATDAVSYNLAFKKLTTRINDSHAFFNSPTYQAWRGGYHPPFLTRFIENEMVITKVLPQTTAVTAGDVIKVIDGQDIYALRDSLREYAHGSNAEIIERELNAIILFGNSGFFSITVDDGTNLKTATLSRNTTNYNKLNTSTNPAWRDTLIDGNCRFGIVDMGRLEVADIPAMFGDLFTADAIVFDIRNYPNGTLWYIVDYLYNASIHIANFTVPDITYPGTLAWYPELIGSGTANPYPGKIVILFDERTQSQAEYTCMGLEQFPGAIKIGSTTAAADGNVAIMYLPGKIATYATFLGTYYPDYTPTQRVGIIPDFEVHPTIAGIRSGQDEVLSFALNCTLVNNAEIEKTENCKVYPNPVKDEIRYELTGEMPAFYEIFDIQGRKLKTGIINTPSGSIDIAAFEPGMYVFGIRTNKSILTKLVVKM